MNHKYSLSTNSQKCYIFINLKAEIILPEILVLQGIYYNPRISSFFKEINDELMRKNTDFTSAVY